MSTTCLYSRVRNTSGATRTFGFLPPHGRTLDADETFTVFGDIRNNLGGNRGGERSVQQRDIIAFEEALRTGQLIIEYTTSPVLNDLTTEEPRELQVNNGTLQSNYPCWYD